MPIDVYLSMLIFAYLCLYFPIYAYLPTCLSELCSEPIMGSMHRLCNLLSLKSLYVNDIRGHDAFHLGIFVNPLIIWVKSDRTLIKKRRRHN